MSIFNLFSDKRAFRNITLGISTAVILLYVVILLVLEPNKQLSVLLLRSIYVLPIIGAFVSTLLASRYTTHYKHLWRLMSLGMFFWLLGEITHLSYVVIYGAGNVPSPSLADLFSIAYLPIILGIMFSLGRVRPPFDSKKKQFIVNVSMAALAALLICYEFVLAPAWYSSPEISPAKKIIAIVFPLFDWIVLSSLLFASHRLLADKIEGWFILVTGAFTFAIIADVILYLHGNQKNPYTLLALMPMASLIAMSAIDEVTGIYIGIIDRSKASSRKSHDISSANQNSLNNTLLPMVATIAIPLIWLSHALSYSSQGISILMAISSAILLLLIYRNHLLLSDNAVLFSKALRDSLTGLNNHRYFHEVLHRMLAKAEKNNKPVSLLILDIDDFSKINNAYGHNYGDKVLISIGRTIVSNLRESDEACRLNGDEFGIILPETGTYRAYNLAKKLRESVNKVLYNAFPETEITVTIGLSTFPTLAKDKDGLLHTADGALYWAKLHGKNNVLLYDTNVVKDLSAEERAKRTEEAAMLDLVRSLAKAVDARDKYTRLHSKRVSTLATKLAKSIKLDDETVNRIEVAGILHDVGKIGIPDNILQKPGRLSDEEMAIVKNHPAFSAQIIKSTSLKDIVSAVKAHHERWDGKGYPYGLKGEQIPLEARILALADTFDAMTSDRPYRKGLPINEALNEIARCAGYQFDPRLAKQFLAMFAYGQDAVENEDSSKQEENIEFDKAASY